MRPARPDGRSISLWWSGRVIGLATWAMSGATSRATSGVAVTQSAGHVRCAMTTGVTDRHRRTVGGATVLEQEAGTDAASRMIQTPRPMSRRAYPACSGAAPFSPTFDLSCAIASAIVSDTRKGARDGRPSTLERGASSPSASTENQSTMV